MFVKSLRYIAQKKEIDSFKLIFLTFWYIEDEKFLVHQFVSETCYKVFTSQKLIKVSLFYEKLT